MGKSSVSSAEEISSRAVWATVIVAALGYFVDVYDLLIFSIVRMQSLKDFNLPESELLSTGVFLLNAQMAGMLVGGVFWGIWGDKKGRLSVLLGSIFLYSIANILNGFVVTVDQYALLRFIAGVGLAGELGAGITLVSELMSKETRGYGTTIVASVGVAGAVAAALVGDLLTWRQAFWVGGALGLALLTLRIGIRESGMFDAIKKNQSVQRGNIFNLFKSSHRFQKYIYCILIGVPVWYVIGILVTFSPEFSKSFGITEAVSAGRSVLFAYIGLIIGDLSCGLLSQLLRSRKKALGIFLGLTIIFVTWFLCFPPQSPEGIYLLFLPMGFAVGYWAVFVTTAAEQFGTNLRSTVTTTVPNFVRGAVVPLTFLFQMFKPSLGLVNSALVVGGICFTIALFSLAMLHETFGKELDFIEGD